MFEAVKAPEESSKEKIITIPLATGIGAGVGIAAEAAKPFVSKVTNGIVNTIKKIFKKKKKGGGRP